MKLEVNNNHKKIRFDKKNKAFYKFKLGVASLLIGVSLFSGASIDAVAKSNDTAVVWDIAGHKEKIPASVSKGLESSLLKSGDHTITEDDLKYVKFLNLDVDEETTDLSYLKYFGNLSNLYLNFKIDDTSVLKTLSEVKSISSLVITTDNYIAIKNEDLSSIVANNNLKSLDISLNVLLEPGCEDILNKLETLSIGNGRNVDIDFTKLTNLKTLDLSYSSEYDIATFLNSKEYNALIKNGVNIKFEDEEDKDIYLKTSKKLDDIVDKLDIKDGATDSEKLDAVIVYVLENYEYDEKVREATNKGEDISKYARDFYSDGLLFGAMEKDTAICGNYAALTEALMDRLCIPSVSYVADSENHAWNVVKINGEPYYVDVTWLDDFVDDVQKEESHYNENGKKVVSITYENQTAADLIKKGKVDTLMWYREDPDENNISVIDKNHSHEAEYIPDYMIMNSNNNKNIEETITNAPEVGDEKVVVQMGGKEIIIGLGALLTIFGVASGSVIAVKKHNKKKREKYLNQMFDSFDSSEPLEPRRYK